MALVMLLCHWKMEFFSKSFKKETLYEFVTIENGGHNDLIKNHKSKIFNKLREFLAHITKICFNDYSNNEINSEFFKKLNPHEGDKHQPSEQNEDHINNMMIKQFVENNELEEINKLKIECENVLNFKKNEDIKKDSKNNYHNKNNNENETSFRENGDIIIEIKE